MKKAFTLIEILIVVAILGIMAAIVVPMFQDNTQKAKEAATKSNLKILRNAIELYASKNNGVPPGYSGNNSASIPSGAIFMIQMVPDYLKTMPENPFNNLNTVQTVSNAAAFPAAATGTFGWVYKPSTKDIRIDTTGTDTDTNSYFGY